MCAVVMALDAMVADDARAMHGRHPMAASSSDKGGSGIDDGISGINRIVVVGGIVIRIIVVVDAADKNPAEVMPPSEPMAGISGNGISRDTRNSGRRDKGRSTNADRAAANKRTAHVATAAETATAAPAARTAAASTTAVYATGVGLLTGDRQHEERQGAQCSWPREQSN